MVCIERAALLRSRWRAALELKEFILAKSFSRAKPVLLPQPVSAQWECQLPVMQNPCLLSLQPCTCFQQLAAHLRTA